MTNGLAIFLVVCIAGFGLVDGLAFDGALSLSLAARFVDLLDWLAFWR